MPFGKIFHRLRMPIRLSISLLMLSATPGYYRQGIYHKEHNATLSVAITVTCCANKMENLAGDKQ